MDAPNERAPADRSGAFGVVLVAYLLALAAALATGLWLGNERPILTVFVADAVATLVIFAFSMALRNSSLYDAYWSLAPPVIALYWAQLPSALGADGVRQGLVLWLVVAWAVRLTFNWARGWAGLGHEDWRYVDLRASAKIPYWLVSLGGIHFFPTVQVFLGCLALYPALTLGTRPFGVLDIVATLVTAGAIAIELLADEQLAAFNRTKQPGEICTRGVWAWSRHPNYFGELSFWWGLWLFGLAADPSWGWTVIGPLAMTGMFLFASIPMLDKRSVGRRPGYAEHMRRVSRLVPWPPRG
jgi:steroid 5-alpha reductase family enzyme